MIGAVVATAVFTAVATATASTAMSAPTATAAFEATLAIEIATGFAAGLTGLAFAWATAVVASTVFTAEVTTVTAATATTTAVMTMTLAAVGTTIALLGTLLLNRLLFFDRSAVRRRKGPSAKRRYRVSFAAQLAGGGVGAGRCSNERGSRRSRPSRLSRLSRLSRNSRPSRGVARCPRSSRRKSFRPTGSPLCVSLGRESAGRLSLGRASDALASVGVDRVCRRGKSGDLRGDLADGTRSSSTEQEKNCFPSFEPGERDPREEGS